MSQRNFGGWGHLVDIVIIVYALKSLERKSLAGRVWVSGQLLATLGAEPGKKDGHQEATVTVVTWASLKAMSETL